MNTIFNTQHMLSLCLHVYSHLSQPPSAQTPSPSPSAQTSASSRPLSSAAPPGTPDAWLRRSAASWTHTQTRLSCQSYIMSTQVFINELLTWRVCTLGRCLWIPSPPVCSVCTVHSGECASALSGPPCWHRSASPSASRSHSDSRSPLTHSDKYEMNSGVSHRTDIKYCTFLIDFLQWYYTKLENHLDGDGQSYNIS